MVAYSSLQSRVAPCCAFLPVKPLRIRYIRFMNSVTFDNQDVVPSKIICIGRNYSAHIEELGNAVPQQMVVFMKPNSSISDTLMSFQGEQLHYEAEICFLIKNGVCHGVGVGIDLTKRALQKELKEKGLPWERAKAFDGAAVFSEFVRLTDTHTPIQIKLNINGKTAQLSDSTQMIHQPNDMITELKTFLSLAACDIIMTGTPAGVGPIHAGETFTASLTQSGNLLVEAEWCAQ